MMRLIMSGGLANQMFQYVFLTAIRKKGYRIKLDLSLYDYVKMHNGYELNRCFGIEEQSIRRHGLYLFFIRALLKYRPRFLFQQEKLGEIMPIPSKNRIFIKGEFQSEQYFKGFENEVRNLFTFQGIDADNIAIEKEMQSCESVSIHIRLGDYVGNSVYEGICTKEYYKKAIDKMLLAIPNAVFFVFSNDVKGAEDLLLESIIGGQNYRMVKINCGTNSYKDMYLMSRCKHNIIANSSFSWWGAWLNNNPQKLVIAPKKWANGESRRYQLIIPTSWISL